MKRFILIAMLATLLILSGCRSKKIVTPADHVRIAKQEVYQQNKYELRAAWMQTAWKSEYQNRSTQELKNLLSQRLDILQQSGFNAVIFQIRPESDAWYYSPYEPWSRFLTGTQGVAPYPLWDPLAWMIEECHKRNMELHAWLNPYRASVSLSNQLAPTHPYYKHPEWFITYGNQMYFNPALPQVRNHLNTVIADIVERYDIDAIHFDDYFYPYPIAGVRLEDFQDFQRNPRGFTDIGDWRRDNVNLLISQLSETIKSIKPYVRFGISPFGIYRNEKSDPKGSKTNGLQNYDDLYADVLLWDAMGWVDYIMPQIYWEIGHKTAEHSELALWWSRNVHLAHYYIGQDVKRTMDRSELHTKLNLAHKTSKGVAMWPGDEIFSNYKGVTTELKSQYWTKPALIPATDYPTNFRTFPEPQRKAGLEKGLLFWEEDLPYLQGLETKYFVIYIHDRGEKIQQATRQENILALTQDEFYRLPDLGGKHKVAFTITRVNRFNQEILVAHDIKGRI